jgi:Fic family protein
MRRIYIHQLPEWPMFTWDQDALVTLLAAVRNRQGRLAGRMESLGFPLNQEAGLETLTADVVKSSEIEGERLNLEQVRSSLARRLGVETGGLKPADRHVDGVVEMVLDATQHYDRPLTADRLWGWHAALFPTGRSGLVRISTAAWRRDQHVPMRVVSGPMGRERVHFEAPAARRIAREMRAFLRWFNGRAKSTDPVMKAALAHLWFVTIHPFADGNGRMARAIADMALTRSEERPQRFYSMSAQIRDERTAYYDVLERTQRGTMDVTTWMTWFLECLDRAIGGAQGMLSKVLGKARFWQALAGVPVNDRQRTVLRRMQEESFEGKLTTSKYAKLARCSQDTALRDVEALVEWGALVRGPGGGRSTSYELAAR